MAWSTGGGGETAEWKAKAMAATCGGRAKGRVRARGVIEGRNVLCTINDGVLMLHLIWTSC